MNVTGFPLKIICGDAEEFTGAGAAVAMAGMDAQNDSREIKGIKDLRTLNLLPDGYFKDVVNGNSSFTAKSTRPVTVSI